MFCVTRSDRWVATGGVGGANSLAWSEDGFIWVGLGTFMFENGKAVHFSVAAQRFAACGQGGFHSVAYRCFGMLGRASSFFDMH